MKFPHVFRIEPSSCCNLRCIHCPTGYNTRLTTGDMSNEIFNRVINGIKEHNTVDKVVLYHGGEPFFNRNIFDMIKKLKTINILFVKTVTNGMMIDDDMLVEIINSRLDSIEFSIDGNSLEENNRIRWGCSYKQVVTNVKKLLNLKIKMDSDKPSVFIANTQIPNKDDIKKDIVTPKFLLEEFKNFKDEIDFKNTYMIKWSGVDLPENYSIADNDGKYINFCDNIFDTITIRWNGDVVPCCYDISSKYVVGNIMEQSLSKIWDNDKYKKLRNSIFNKNLFPICSDCVKIRPGRYVVKDVKNKCIRCKKVDDLLVGGLCLHCDNIDTDKGLSCGDHLGRTS